MEDVKKYLRLRIYISSTDKLKNSLLYETLVYQAKRYGLAGATVTKGIMGYGVSSVVHSYKFWEISEKVPVVVEVLDEEPLIEKFYHIILPYLKNMRYGCLVTVDKVDVWLSKPGEKPKLFK
ncbi:MAG: DUF190 domain-containing protein [Bacteroidales bacterium]|nr:DUF190 domain-containing protein [Bacteroidales bacterium]HPD95628.1 DUF190 domain-containing protein [Tenuifilaceae bacterium]HRX32005.1 DUF190 domain-containing protein [Tenuifilaceae bacterium]